MQLASPVNSSDTPVAESDVQLYIDVYSQMQRDHDLRIEDALAGHGISVPEFREIERRIQVQAPVIQRVRNALLDEAKSHAASMAFPAPSQDAAP